MLKLFNAGFSKWQLFAMDFPVRTTQLKVKAWPKTAFLPLSLSLLSLSRRERERSEGAGRERPRTSENQANLTLEQFSF